MSKRELESASFPKSKQRKLNECAANKGQLCNDENCNDCQRESFASHEKSKYWSKKNQKNPRDVSKKTQKTKYWFDCDKCNHSFQSKPYNITVKGQWCPYCASHKLCNNNNCNNCFEKSFASYEKAKYWSTENKNKPRDVFKASGTK
eukprot:125161_1